ncbi:TPA: restriction endonuclease subunit S [Enterococcus faecium]|jgi:restriction endonuclease, S subunit|uniref:restriction endonuclease subunit S n=1 Tax=Blautia wexlerae TaxID=418240 RepID=UPI00156FAC68|nr:restriction endonuclease subunit S [Blautia wexlerae]NSD51017.1 restriction endonuclease subunit S [Blautia wexlerae]NSK03632.1 restriction endonuclease subunit S [Blautia wexlerae]
MKSNYDILGNHIRLIDTRNRESITDRVLGINIDKFFMPSVANVIGTDLSKYKLITKGKFACNPMHVGRDERLPVALYDEEKPAIVSPAYFMFEVIDNSILNEDYLMMWFRRPEFDRICWLHTDGSVRGGITWDDICRLELPIPPIENQLEIVNSYKAITERIALKQKINDNLEATAQAYFDSLFFDESEPNCTLADIALVNPVRPLAKGVEARYFEMATLPTNGCIPTGDFIKPYNGGVRFINGDTLIARITPCLENGKAAYINILEDNEVAFGSTEYIVFASKGNMPSSFYYFLIRNAKFVTFALQFMNGSSGRQRVSGEELASFPLCRPSCENLEAFDKVASLVLEQMKDNTYEIQKLKQLQEVIAATISSC